MTGATARAREVAVGLASVGGLRHPYPDFLVIGARKGGTSSLHRYLVQHPLVRPAARKEPRYFSSHWHRGPLWYRSLFPTTSELRAAQRHLGRRPLAFEATPDYLAGPEVPARVARRLPRARFVALVRDPVDRAWSDYQAHLRAGRERRRFGEVVAAELEALGPGEGTGDSIGPGEGTGPGPGRPRVVALGLYADQLARWDACVGSDRLLVLCSEDLFVDPAATLGRVTDFLGLPPHEGVDLTPRNRGGYEDGPDLDSLERLRSFFAPPNRVLYERLGRDLGWQ